MISKDDAKMFLNKFVGVSYTENERECFNRGGLKEVTDNCIVMDVFGRRMIISFSSILKIKELRDIKKI